MSVLIKDKTTGEWEQVAGNGKAEYGASTVRTGLVTNSVEIPPNGYDPIDVVFSSPMPDSDYLISLEVSGGYWHTSTIYTATYSKTVTGFRIHIGNPGTIDTIPASTLNIKYTAFKLYTDTEYDSLLELPDRVEELETVTSGTFTRNSTNVSTVASAEAKIVGGSGCLGLVCRVGVEVSTYSEITLGTITVPGFSNVNGQGLGFNQDTGLCSWVYSQNGSIKLAAKGVAVPVDSWIYASIPLVGTLT